jgi:hypothetical protein
MSGGGQPAPDLPCRAARPVGGTSDQSTPEIAMAATTGKKNPHDRPAHHYQYHQVSAGSGVTCFGFARMLAILAPSPGGVRGNTVTPVGAPGAKPPVSTRPHPS